MSDIIESAIAEAVAATTEAQPQADAKPETAIPVQQPNAEESPQEDAKPEVELTPEEKAKKLENELARARKSRNRARRAEESLKKELETLRAERTQQKPEIKPTAPNDDDWTPEPNSYGIPVPKMDDYSSVMKYMRAVAKYDRDVEQAAMAAKQQETHVSAEYEKLRAERNHVAAQEYEELSKSNPEILQDLAEYQDVFQVMHPSLDLIILQADKPLRAAHYLANEGVLDELPSMPLEAAQYVIKTALARMQKAPTPPQTKQQTQAPKPMAAAKGTGTAGKSVDRMEYAELRDWLRS